MKKSYKRGLRRAFIILLIFILLIVGFMVRIYIDVLDLTPIESKNIVGNIYSVHESLVNSYIIKDGENYIAIDAGFGAEAVLEELEKLKINPKKVIAVLLTHTDQDHVAALSFFPNAKIYLGEDEEKMIDGSTTRLFMMKNAITSEKYSLIKDQQVFNIGNIKIKGILTPGHTPGSMSFLIDDKYLFTGDLLRIKSGKITVFNRFFNMDSEASSQSIDKIANLPNCEYIFTGHHGVSKNYRKLMNEWKKDRKK